MRLPENFSKQAPPLEGMPTLPSPLTPYSSLVDEPQQSPKPGVMLGKEPQHWIVKRKDRRSQVHGTAAMSGDVWSPFYGKICNDLLQYAVIPLLSASKGQQSLRREKHRRKGLGILSWGDKERR